MIKIQNQDRKVKKKKRNKKRREVGVIIHVIMEKSQLEFRTKWNTPNLKPLKIQKASMYNYGPNLLLPAKTKIWIKVSYQYIKIYNNQPTL